MTGGLIKKRAMWLLVIAPFLLLLSADPTHAQSGRTIRWARYDVTIDNIVTSQNRFDVTENYELDIIVGPFSFGTASIPTDRLDRIENITFTDGGRPLTQSCSGQPGTYCIERNADSVDIQYYFTSNAFTGSTKQIEMKYTVYGALRSYEGGDQLYWMAVPPDRFGFAIQSSRVLVRMPEDRPPQVVAYYPDGGWTQSVEGNTVTFTSQGSLGTTGYIEVRVQYPHDSSMAKPDWQASFDSARDYEERIQPFVSLGLVILGVLIGIGGPIWLYIQYARHGRDAAAVVVPEYLTEPPNETPPAVVGALLTEHSDMQGILATLVDLARRGYIVFEQTENEGIFGLFKSSDFTFHRTDRNAEASLTPYEQTLLRGIFGVSDSVEMADLRNKFYRHIDSIHSGVYNQLVSNGYFVRQPNVTRNMWMMGGVGITAIAVVLGLIGWESFDRISPVIPIPLFALGFVGVLTLMVGNVMPAKTAKGSQDAARWKAFRTYLENIKKYVDVSQVSEQFEKYMPYAVLWGISQQWIRQFEGALTSMPTWYYPNYLGGRWHRGYRGPYQNQGEFGRGSSDIGDMGRGMGDLNDMNKSLSEGLNSMSAGLTSMLNSVSNVMTSRPSSSSSGGSGGFSGGGGGGGGSSGGGSRGFG